MGPYVFLDHPVSSDSSCQLLGLDYIYTTGNASNIFVDHIWL